MRKKLESGFAGYKTAPGPARYSTRSGFAPIIILIAILVLGGVVGAFYLGKQANKPTQLTQQTPSTFQPPSPTQQPTISPTATGDTENWKTYTNTKYNFSLKYPSNWKYLEVPNSTYPMTSEAIWFTHANFPPPQTDALADIQITITTNNPSVNWQPQNFDNYKVEPYQLGHLSATKISGINTELLGRQSVIITKLADKLYLQALQNQSPESSQYFDQILSTFRFTN